MSLGWAVALFIVFAVGFSVCLFLMSKKGKKKWMIAGTCVFGLLALAMAGYTALTFLFVGANSDKNPPPEESRTSEPTDSGQQSGKADDEMFDFAELDGLEFWLGSGVGAWSTILQVQADGVFYGDYMDSEMGETGEDNPGGTVYFCEVSGEFTSVKKISDYEYTLQCEIVSMGGNGLDGITDGIEYVVSDPYGLDDGEFRLYLPGKKVSELPEEYLEWTRSAIDDSDELEFYGLYNVEGGQGFSSYYIDDEDETYPDADGEYVATLVVDFSAGSAEPNQREILQEYDGALDIDTLSMSLSAVTGLDFFVDGRIDGDRAYVAWWDDSSLVAGIGDREQNEDFHFYDAISLNWFMLDSLAATIKANFPDVTEVYYTGENGEGVVFPNPEDMAAEGLPVLPVDMPYEGSAFYAAHSDVRGDDDGGELPAGGASGVDPADVNWWGQYISYDYFLNIVNYDGKSFYFVIDYVEATEEGVAAINPNNPYSAQYGEMIFTFDGADTIVITGGDYAQTYTRYVE